MKLKIILALIALAAVKNTTGQIRYIPSTARTFSVSGGGGATILFGDLETKKIAPAGRVNFDYKLSQVFLLGVEVQAGQLRMDKLTVTNGKDMMVKNNFIAANVNTRFYFGKLLNAGVRSAVNGFYIGVGVGVINSNITNNKSDSILNTIAVLSDRKTNTTALVIPLNFGYDLDLSTMSNVQRLGININYQHNIATDDYLDQFHIAISSNRFPDSYGFLSVGVRYYFGKIKG